MDPTYIDTELVKCIGINRTSNSIEAKLDSHLVTQTIHLGDFADENIGPLKRQLEQILLTQYSAASESLDKGEILLCHTCKARDWLQDAIQFEKIMIDCEKQGNYDARLAAL